MGMQSRLSDDSGGGVDTQRVISSAPAVTSEPGGTPAPVVKPATKRTSAPVANPVSKVTSPLGVNPVPRLTSPPVGTPVSVPTSHVAVASSKSLRSPTPSTQQQTVAKLKGQSKKQVTQQETTPKLIQKSARAKVSKPSRKKTRRLAKYLKIKMNAQAEYNPGDVVEFGVYYRKKKLTKPAYTLSFTPPNWAKYENRKLRISQDAPKSGTMKVCLKSKSKKRSPCKKIKLKIQSLAELDILP